MTATLIRPSEFLMPCKQVAASATTTKTQLSPTEAILAEQVEMTYQSGGQQFHALKQINLAVRRGEIQLLMGPSGSGKTTLLSILAGMLAPTSGKVHLLGQEITGLSPKQLTKFRRDKIGFIFQGFNLFPALTAAENVEVALKLQGIRGRAARREAMQLLEQVGLADKAKLLPRNLSGGQKQRVAIARALAGHPEAIMADEPTAALDSESGYAVTELLHRLAKEEGCTVLIVTHDPRITDIADRVAYLEDGELQQTTTRSQDIRAAA